MRTPRDHEGRRGWLPGIWGCAEATLFFLVPDVLLTRVALDGARPALTCCLWALAGALLGGTAMHGWGHIEAARARRVLAHVPAIDPEMIDRVGRELSEGGALPMLWGPLAGTPYKIYAVEAGRLGISLPWFLLVSIPARAIRFVAVSLLAAWLASLVRRRWSQKTCQMLQAVFWVIFYG